jgi:hypothetical protein
MPSVGFEPTIPASERAKTVHALDRSATVTGKFHFYAGIVKIKVVKDQVLPLSVFDRKRYSTRTPHTVSSISPGKPV